MLLSFLFFLSADIPPADIATNWLPLWVGIITASSALFGVAFTGVIAHRLKKMELQFSVTEEKRQRRIDRLEELHKGLVSMIGASSGFIADYSEFKQSGGTSPKEISEILAKINGSFSELWSIQRIYFPTGDDIMTKVYGQLCELIKTGTTYLMNPVAPIEVFVKPHQAMLNQCLDLREMVKKEIQLIVK